MPDRLPSIYLARHGQTAWALSGQHTGRSDIPLTAAGEDEARALAPKLNPRTFAAVFTSPSLRARRTATLAGYPEAVVEDDLAEWAYGDYEGLTSSQIIARQPGWNVFINGGPNGESPDEVTDRADRIVARLRAIDGDVLIFTSGHFGRCVGCRWIGQPITLGAALLLSTASLSVLGYDHSREEPGIKLWNETGRE